MGRNARTADGQGHAIQKVAPGDAAVHTKISIGHRRQPSTRDARANLIRC